MVTLLKVIVKRDAKMPEARGRRIGKDKEYTCIKCSKVFIAPNYNHRKYCNDCSLEVKRERKRLSSLEYSRRYRQTPEGKRKIIEYRQSPKVKLYMAEYCSLYYQLPEHKIAKAKTTAKYQHTPKGRCAMAIVKAKRRIKSTNPALYGTTIKLLHSEKQPCSICGKPYATNHEIDHIVPLFKGGTDNSENLRSLCYKCHRRKSGDELKGRGYSLCI